MPQDCDKGPSVIPSVTMLEKWRNPIVHAVGHSGREVSRKRFKRDLVKGGGSASPGDDLHPHILSDRQDPWDGPLGHVSPVGDPEESKG